MGGKAILCELLAATWEPSSFPLDASAASAPLVAANSDPFSLGLSQPPQRSSNTVHPRVGPAAAQIPQRKVLFLLDAAATHPSPAPALPAL